MKIESKNADDELELNMSPMIDMVFLLLIFFLVAATVIEDKVPVEEIPTAVYAKVKDDQTGRLVVSINKEEELFFGVDERPLELEELKWKLQEETARVENTGENLKILVRADGDVTYEVSEKILMICREVGATNLLYAAFEGSEVKP